MSSPSPLPLSKVRRAGALLFLSGELPLRDDGSIPDGIEAQTALTLDRIEATLKGEGLGLDDIVSMTVYLTHLEDFAAFNRVYAARFKAPYPSRTTVRADLVRPGARLELTAVALARA
jgi:2-iminobutanoate/2-iminopropanoate deaminase